MSNTFGLFSLLLMVIFAYAAVSVRGGNTEYIKSWAEKVDPSVKPAYCKQMSYPFFLIALVELADTICQFAFPTFGNSAGSLIMITTGAVIGIIWAVTVQNKFTKGKK